MLNNDSLDQLRSLKQQMSTQKQQLEEQKVRAVGSVKGSQGRFGFVSLEDGRDIYLPPEQMQRVFPDDRVQIEIIAGTDGKPSAVLEKLLESPLGEFTGHYVVRDNAHFVEPDLPRLSRWIFIPPKARANAQAGDWLRCRIARHPFSDGKPQARIEQIIGAPGSAGLEQRYALARFRLPDAAPAWDESALDQPDWNARRDLTDLPFVTIDGADTQDMDDALYAQREGDGWALWVAIADASAWIVPGSAQEQAIAARGTSVYMPGRTVAMLPEQLANARCSLREGEDRLALVCRAQVKADGCIGGYEFIEARVRSRAKLDYDQVATLLDGSDAAAQPWHADVRELHALALALQQQRRRDHLLMPEQPDYHFTLDEQGKIAAIQRVEKTAAHRLVEECMVAANRCAADFLKAQAALFVGHNGFRPERRDNVMRLIAEQLPALPPPDIGTLAGYTALMQALDDSGSALPLRTILSRSLERSQFRTDAAAHFGMGLPHYTTITSPIRKYNDFLLHRLIRAKLRGGAAPAIDAQQLAQLQEQSDRARQAANLAEQWLKCDYLNRLHQAQPKAVLRGTISHINSSGFTVRLADSGIQGFVDLRNTGKKYSFDTVYMRLSSADAQYQLEQEVEVSVASVDMKRRTIALQLAAGTADSAVQAG